MPDIEKRLRYFTGQFLQEEDFTDEQAYHVDRQRRHNRLFHTPGIAEGLEVEAAAGSTQAVVRSGSALDSEGQQIVLPSNRTVPLNTPELRDNFVFLVISYHDEPSDIATTGKPEARRMHEIPRVQALVDDSNLPSERTHIRLARLRLDPNGSVVDHDQSVRVRAGVSIGDQLELNELRLRRAGDTRNQWPVLSSNARGNLNITGSLSVNGQNFRSGWVRLPFLPKKLSATPPAPPPPEFSLFVFRATSDSSGAAGSIEIPVPPGVTRITRFRIAGNRNAAGITITLWRVNLGNPVTQNQLLRQTLAASSNPFNEIFTIASGSQPLNAETQAIALQVEAAGESDIAFVAAEFG